jgi:hypothetical protein
METDNTRWSMSVMGIFRQPSHTASVQRKMAAMYMQDKYHNARGVIYTIGLAVLAVLLVWKFVVR